MKEEQAPMDFYDGNGKRLLRLDNPPGTIQFHAGITSIEVIRLSSDGVWVNPDIKPDEAAQVVLNALDKKIKVLVKRAVEAEREACAAIARQFDVDHPSTNYGRCIARIIEDRNKE